MYIDGITEHCPDDCCGCSCHICPPCGHCTEHYEPEEED